MRTKNELVLCRVCRSYIKCADGENLASPVCYPSITPYLSGGPCCGDLVSAEEVKSGVKQFRTEDTVCLLYHDETLPCSCAANP